MSSICRICLRSDLLLQTPNGDLEQFYNELCEYDCDITIKLCEACLYSLKKCYRFKQRCQLAVKILKEWRKKKKCGKKSIKFLYTDMPKSQLSLCNKNNFKVYFYQAPDVNTAAPIQISNCRHPHVVTVNIPPSEYTEDVQIEPPIKFERSEMSEDEIYLVKEVDPNLDQNDMEYKMEFTELDSTEFNCNISEDETNADSKVEEDSDASLDELLSNIQTKSLLKDKKLQKPKEYDNEAREKLRMLLQSKFESSGVVKDDKGNVIDMDLVLSCLDKSSEKTVRNIINICSGPGPFKPNTISKMSELISRSTKYDSIFTTTYFRDESQIREEFEKRRENIKYTSSEHRCEKCIRGFKSSEGLDTHIKTFHDESLGYVCEYCQVRCRNKKSLTNHIYFHSLKYTCKLCHFVTHSGNTVRRHFNTHKGVTYQCKYCEACFGCESKLYFHLNKTHASRQNICGFCGHTFNNDKGLNYHKFHKHRGEEFAQSELNKKCDECDVTFINEVAYNTHLRITHEVAGIEIKRKRKIHYNYNIERKKKKRVTKIFKIVCRVCNVEGKSPGWLKAHFMKEHPNEDMEKIYSSTKKYLCQECGKRFISITALRYHKNTHTGVKPFACDKCPAKFSARINLTYHLQRHLPPSKECQHCGKKFVSFSNLSNHMRTHIGDRRFKCDICAKGFLHQSALNEHVRGVHHHIRRVKKKPVKTDVE